MLDCPWCKGALLGGADPESPCPSCKRVPSQHPSRQALDFELALPPAEAARAPLAGPAPTAVPMAVELDDEPDALPLDLAISDGPIRAAPPDRGSGTADLDDEPAGILLETDWQPSRAGGPAAAALAAGDAASRLEPPAEAPLHRIAAGPAPAATDMDPFEIAAVADFGPAPAGWVQAPAYAWRVRQRRSELARETTRMRAALAEAEAARTERFAEIARVLRARTPAGDRLAALLEPLAQHDQASAAREAALRETGAGYADAVGRVDAGIAALDAQRAELDAAVAQAEAERDERAAARARAEAKVKRLDIELRAAHEAARVAAGPDAKIAPPEHAVRIAALQEERGVRTAELEPIAAAAAAAEAALRAREAKSRDAGKQLAALRDERRAVEAAASRQLAIRSDGAKAAERERVAAYAAALREVLAALPEALTAEERAAAADGDRVIAARSRDIEKRVRAMASADREAERRGWIVVGVVAGLVLLLLLSVVRTAAR